MTREKYYEMCEMLGTEPDESEVPLEFDDLLIDVQEAIQIYNKLKDEWDGMNGVYLGKSYSGIVDIFDLLEVPREDRLTLFELIGIIDQYRSEALARNRPKTSK